MFSHMKEKYNSDSRNLLNTVAVFIKKKQTLNVQGFSHSGTCYRCRYYSCKLHVVGLTVYFIGPIAPKLFEKVQHVDLYMY